MPFASHIARRRVLAGTRARIFKAILDEPGINMTRLAATCNVANGQIMFHTAVLEHFDYIHTQRVSRSRRYYPTALVSADEARVDAHLAEPLTGRVFQAVAEEPGANQRTIASRFPHRTRQAIGWHLQRLIEAGAITRRRDGKSVRYEPCIQAA